VGGNGAIINSGAAQISALRNLTLAGDTTIGGIARWDLRAVSGGTVTLAGNGYNLAKVGANYIAVVGGSAAAAVTGVQNININNGTLALANNTTVDNNSPGSIFINSSGFLDVGNWGSSPGVVVNKPIVLAGGTLETDTTATGNSGNGTIAAGITLNSGGTDTIAPHSTSTLTLNGMIADGTANALTFSGTGTTVLGIANTYDGTTILSAGTLRLANQYALQNTTLAMSGGVLVFDSSITGNAFTIGGLAAGASGAGYNIALQNNAGTPAAIALTVGGNNANTAYAAVLSGGGSLVKSGGGTLTLSGSSTFAGSTTVSSGILLVTNLTGSGTGSGPVAVNAGGTLGGNGIISGPVTVNSGGALSPGNPLGTLTVNNSLTLGAGGTTFVQVQHSPLTNDAVKISGTLNEGGTLNVTNSGAAAFAAGDSFKLFSAGNYAGAFSQIILPPLTGNLVWNTNLLKASGTLSVAAYLPPTIAQLAVNGSSLQITGGGGIAGWTYYVLSSTNLTVPRTSWTRVLTNQFDGAGSFNFTSAVDPAAPQTFYYLQLQ
jgi:autotransporter-associated beta strand protein